LKGIIFHKRIISILGDSAMGKTTLAVHMVGHYLMNNQCSFWIQAGEKFPHKRLYSLFKNNPSKLKYLQDNIFIIPIGKTCSSYNELLNIIKKLVNNEYFFPNDLNFIVIDNISHQLRFEIAKLDEIQNKVNLINEFFDHLLLPLIFFCQKRSICLILIHESSFQPNLARNMAYQYKLYERIDSVEFNLINMFGSSIKKITISFDDIKWNFNYEITNSGFLLYR
jgi:archaellum biogenesis ATPase FlaH